MPNTPDRRSREEAPRRRLESQSEPGAATRPTRIERTNTLSKVRHRLTERNEGVRRACEDLVDYHRVFNAGNDLDRTTALLTGLDVYPQNTLQPPHAEQHSLEQTKDIAVDTVQPLRKIAIDNAPVVFVGFGVSAPER